MISAGWVFTHFLGIRAQNELRDDARSYVTNFATVLKGALSEIDHKAQLLSANPAVVAILSGTRGAAVYAANSALDRHGKTSSGLICYVLDNSGKTIASSNRDRPDSFVGKSYVFRPYFKDAVSGKPAWYFALGVTTGERGYYAGFPVWGTTPDPIGVAVIKKPLADSMFHHPPEGIFMVIDPHGVIFLSGRKDFLFRALWSLPDETRKSLIAGKQFGPGPFPPLLARKPANEEKVIIKGIRYSTALADLELGGWSIVYLHPTTEIVIYRLFGMSLTFGICFLIVIFHIAIQRMGKSATEVARSHALLESSLESTADGILVVDQEGKIEKYNRKFAAMWGGPEEILASGDANKVVSHISGQLKNRDVFLQNVRKLFKDTSEESLSTVEFTDGRVFEYYSTPKQIDGRHAGRVWSIRDITERERTEEDLRETRDYLENLFRYANAPVIVWDPGYRITRFNHAFERLTGRLAGEVLGSPLDILFSEDRREEAMAHIRRTTTGERWETVEIPILHVDGAVRTVLWNSATLYSADGSAVVATIAQGQDITEREQAVEQILWNYHTQKALTSILQVSLEHLSLREKLDWVLDVLLRVPWIKAESKGCIFLVEDDAETLVMAAHRGIPPELLPTCGTVAFGKCLCGKSASSRKMIFSGGGDEDHEFHRDNAGGHGHYCVPIQSNDKVLGVINLYMKAGHEEAERETGFLMAVCNTLTGTIERDRAEKELKRLATAVEQAGEIFMITDLKGEIQYINPAFERITGYRCVEAMGKNPRILKSGEHDEAFYKELWATLLRDEIWFGKFTNRRKDGALYEQDAVISPVRDESGKVVNYVGVMRDVTRENQLSEQLRQSQKMEAIGKLAGGVAHDFNNMLTAIDGYSELLLSGLGENSPLSADVMEIRKAGDRAAGLTRQLLAFSRMQVLQPKVIDLNDLVGNIQKMLARLIGENIELLTNPGEKLGRVKADPGQIEQVLLNLVVNARDALPKGGRITIETSNENLSGESPEKHVDVRPGPYVMLAVTDNGAGMDEKTISRIFDPFFTTKDLGKGTGLGLATVYGIVKQSGGYIWVYSEVGRGTTFKIYLPRVDEDAVEMREREASARQAGGSETILLVEDTELVRNLVLEVLTRSGYTVLEATNGGEALVLCGQRTEPIHLLLTDMMMPGMTGTELAARLLPLRPGIRVLYMSGYTEYGTIDNAGLPAGSLFIQKPFTTAALARKVREALDS
jgi:PAS domain S-box-containing protein